MHNVSDFNRQNQGNENCNLNHLHFLWNYTFKIYYFVNIAPFLYILRVFYFICTVIFYIMLCRPGNTVLWKPAFILFRSMYFLPVVLLLGNVIHLDKIIWHTILHINNLRYHFSCWACIASLHITYFSACEYVISTFSDIVTWSPGIQRLVWNNRAHVSCAAFY